MSPVRPTVTVIGINVGYLIGGVVVVSNDPTVGSAADIYLALVSAPMASR